MFWIIIAFLATLLTIGGDYFIKRAGMDGGIHWKFFAIGMAIYMVVAASWFFIFQHLKLTAIGVIYGVSTVLFLTLLAVFVFNEQLKAHEVVGVVLAISSILLLARFS